MGTASVTYPLLVNFTDSDADEINQNYADVIAFLNGEVVHVDGTKAMTGILTLPATDPTTANHATRKAYVDQGPPSSVIDQDSSLGSDTVSAANAWQEWGSGGAQVVTITNPGRKVSIHAFLTGDATAAVARVAGVRLGITIDGNTANATYGRATDFFAAALQPHAFAAQHARLGVTPTGSIKVIAEIYQVGGAASDVTWNGGNLVVRVVPAI